RTSRRSPARSAATSFKKPTTNSSSLPAPWVSTGRNSASNTTRGSDVIWRVRIVFYGAFHRLAATFGVSTGGFVQEFVFRRDRIGSGVGVALGDDLLGRAFRKLHGEGVLLRAVFDRSGDDAFEHRVFRVFDDVEVAVVVALGCGRRAEVVLDGGFHVGDSVLQMLSAAHFVFAHGDGICEACGYPFRVSSAR